MITLDTLIQVILEAFTMGFGNVAILAVVLIGILTYIALETRMDRSALGIMALAAGFTFKLVGVGTNWMFGLSILIGGILLWMGIQGGSQ